MRSRGLGTCALVGAALLAGCGGSGSDSSTSPAQRGVEQATRFEKYTLYYLGRRFAGLPLLKAESEPQKRGSPDWVLGYGECSTPPGADEGGCTPPLVIVESSICRDFPGAKGAPGNPARTVRGAEVVSPEGRSFGLYTGRTALRVSSNQERTSYNLSIIRALRPIADVPPPRPLPPPAPGSLAGRLSCQK